MNNQKFQKFAQIENLLRCPLCKEALQYSEKTLTCINGHCFDISSKGYLNLLPNQKSSKEYNHDFFENRRLVLDKGFYSHILDGIKEYIQSQKGITAIIDAGCGEGYYSKSIQDLSNIPIIGFDISKDAIQIAAKGGNGVCWLVSDITNIPLQSDSVDCILNIFTPANYDEFSRILSQDGFLIKVVPGESHLIELRQAMQGYVPESYSNKDVVDYFEKHFKLIDKLDLKKTLTIDREALKDFCHMTPLLFGVDKTLLDNYNIEEITIHGEILIGRSI